MRKYLARIIFFSLFLLALWGCNKDYEVADPVTEEKYFYEKIDVENFRLSYQIGDTIWFSAEIPEQLKDIKNNEMIALENGTFIFRGYINCIAAFDSLSFIDNNFELVQDTGEVLLKNVIYTNQTSYSFDIKSGKPLESNNIRLGIIVYYPGIFAAEYSGWVYYGTDRTNYFDFSLDNETGYIDMSFSNDSINDSLFNSLPVNYRYYYGNYYNSVSIVNKKFFFFEVEKQ